MVGACPTITVRLYPPNPNVIARALFPRLPCLHLTQAQGDPSLSDSVVRPVATAMRETILEILTAAQARGELRPGLDLEAAARAVNAWVIALADSQLLPYLNAYFQVTDETVTFERALDAALSILEKGLMSNG